MDVNEVRRRNYGTLYERFCAKEAQQGFEPRGSLKRFGEFVGISPRYLSHVVNNRKQVGADTARKIEAAFKLPHGWMDASHVGGVDPASDPEREFLDLALRLFRASPLEAQSLLVRAAADRLLVVKPPRRAA